MASDGKFDLFLTSSILRQQLWAAASCRETARSKDPWHRIPLNVYSWITQAKLNRGADFELVVMNNSVKFIRSHGRAGVIFKAGSIRSASAHQLAYEIHRDFLQRAIPNVHQSDDDDIGFLYRIDDYLDSADPVALQNTLAQIPDFDAIDLGILLEQEYAFASNASSDDEQIEKPKMNERNSRLVTRAHVAKVVGLERIEPEIANEWGEPVLCKRGQQPARYDADKILPILKKQFVHVTNEGWEKLLSLAISICIPVAD